MRTYIKNNQNINIGHIDDEGHQKVAYSASNIRLGTFRDGSTYDASNIKIADGDILSALIFNNR